MGLKKVKTIKGIECDYHIITSNSFNKERNQTIVMLKTYPSQAVRELSLANEQASQRFFFDGDLKTSECYVKIKESNMSVWDESSGVAEEDFVPEELNFFADAEDILE